MGVDVKVGTPRRRKWLFSRVCDVTSAPCDLEVSHFAHVQSRESLWTSEAAFTAIKQ